MSVTTSCLYETAYAPNSETTVYTSTGLRTIVDKLTSYATGAVDVTLRIVPSGGSAGASNALAKKTFTAGESYTWPELVGHTLEAGDFISVLASAASTATLRIGGRKVT